MARRHRKKPQDQVVITLSSLRGTHVTNSYSAIVDFTDAIGLGVVIEYKKIEPNSDNNLFTETYDYPK